MTQPTTKPKPTDQSTLSFADVALWVILALLVFVAIVALLFARRLYAPVDSIVTQRVCSEYGETLSRERVDHERSNRFSLVDRTDGYCVFGPVQDLEAIDGGASTDDGAAAEDIEGDPAAQATIQVSLADLETDRFYTAIKWMGVIFQLGVASLAVRIVADPLLDRFVRRRA